MTVLFSRYFSLLQDKQSPVPVVDVQAVKAEVPLPTPPPEAPPAFVLGGEDDRTVDVVGVKAAATHFGVQPVVLPDMAHDVMLVRLPHTLIACICVFLHSDVLPLHS